MRFRVKLIPSAGCKIYIDAEQLDDADYEDAGYASMDVVTAPLYVGCKEDAAGAQAEFFDGEMALLGVSATELTAAQVWYLHKRMMGLAGL